MKRVLFIGHEASRTGAPIVLLHLLRGVRDAGEWQADVLLLAGGEMEAEYKSLARVYRSTASASGLRRKLTRLAGGVPLPVVGEDVPQGYDVVVGNTIVSLGHLAAFKQRGCRTILWLHELEDTIAQYYRADDLRVLLRSVDHVICASRAVEAVVRRYAPQAATTVIYEFAPTPEVDAVRARGTVLAELGWDNNAFIVGGCGVVSERKGTDILTDAAVKVLERDANVRFLWIGGPAAGTEDFARRQMERIEESGIAERFVVTGRVEDPFRYLAALDVFALPSREDPFPLVCLEAAAFAKPIVCFADAGGIPEFVSLGAGTVLSDQSVDLLAASITVYADDPQLARTHGSKALELISTKFSPYEMISRFIETISSAAG